MWVIVLEVGETYSNPMYLVNVMPIGFADKLDEGCERKKGDKDDSKVFYRKSNMVCTISQEGRFGEEQVRGESKGGV